jgi:hypothetical protein
MGERSKVRVYEKEGSNFGNYTSVHGFAPHFSISWRAHVDVKIVIILGKLDKWA